MRTSDITTAHAIVIIVVSAGFFVAGALFLGGPVRKDQTYYLLSAVAGFAYGIYALIRARIDGR